VPKLDLAINLVIFFESPVVMWMLPWETRPNAGRDVMSWTAAQPVLPVTL